MLLLRFKKMSKVFMESYSQIKENFINAFSGNLFVRRVTNRYKYASLNEKLFDQIKTIESFGVYNERFIYE